MKKILPAFLLFLTLPLYAQISPAGSSGYSGDMVNETGIAYNQNFYLDLSHYNASHVSVEVVYGSDTLKNVVFSTSSYSLNSGTIHVANNWVTGVPVLYGVGSSPPISGLTNQTTYYAIAVNNGQLELGATSVAAQAGTYIRLASSTTLANSYSLTPLAIAGTPTLQFQSSNNNVTWANNPSTGTFSISAYTNPNSVQLVDFSFYNYRYLRLQVVAPTAGALYLQGVVSIKADGKSNPVW